MRNQDINSRAWWYAILCPDGFVAHTKMGDRTQDLRKAFLTEELWDLSYATAVGGHMVLLERKTPTDWRVTERYIPETKTWEKV